jgi:hypothetical protein
MISRSIKLAISCATLALSAAALTPEAHADWASGTWVGPNGGVAHWHGRGGPGHYRGTVVVTTPDGRTYRRITRVRRGPDGVYASRRWVGPNGAVYYGGRAPY